MDKKETISDNVMNLSKKDIQHYIIQNRIHTKIALDINIYIRLDLRFHSKCL